MSNPEGYRLDFKPGDPCFYTPKEYASEQASGRDGAQTRGLFRVPQPGCPDCIEVYRGWCWVQPRYARSRVMFGFVPLYRGPLPKDGSVDGVVFLLFPSFVEDALNQKRPDIYSSEKA